MKMKRKGIILASAILGSVAVVSTGFAAWVISSPTTTTETGNIQVETVTDNRTSFSVAFADGNKSIKFAAPATMDKKSPWLTNDNNEAKEDLTASFDVTVEKAGEAASGKVKVTLEIGTMSGEPNPVFADETETILAGNKNAKDDDDEVNASLTYFTLPEGFVKDGETGVYTMEVPLDASGKATIPAVFDWGTAFNKENPYDYYNAKAYSDKLGNAALANLDALNDLINGKTFKFTISHVPAATE